MILFFIYINYILYNINSLNFNIIFWGFWFFIIYFVLIIFYHKKSRKINKNNSIKKFEINNTIRSLIIYSVFIFLWFYLYDIWAINFDYNFWIETLLWFLLFVMYHDAYFYFWHRFMHIPIIYKYSHVIHHKSVFSNIMSAYNFWFLEIFVYAFAVIPILFFELNIYAFLWAIFINDLWNIIWHSGYEFFKSKNKKNNCIFKFFLITTYHDLHHSSNNWNYELYFWYLDKFFGTSDIKNK